MRARRHRALDLAALLAVVACGAHCGIVYTGDQPLWYVPCTGSDVDCQCSGDLSSGDAYTMTPAVEECSGAKAAGLCCATSDYPSYGNCACKAVRCANDSAKCQCSVWPSNQGDLDKCTPFAGESCCLAPGATTCTCSPTPCQAGETQVIECSAQYFSCALLQADNGFGYDFLGYDTGVSACSAGAVQATGAGP